VFTHDSVVWCILVHHQAPLILSEYLVTCLLNNNKQGTSIFKKSFRPATCVLMRLEFID